MRGANSHVQITIGAAMQAGFNAAFREADSRIRKIGDELSSLRRNRGAVEAFRAAEDATKRANYAWQASKAKLDAFRAGMEGVEKPTKRQTAELAKLEKAAARAFDVIGEERAELSRLRGALRDAGIDTRKLADEQDKLGAAVGRAEAKLEKQRRLAAGRADVRAQGSALAGQALGLGATAAGVGYPVVNAVRASADFEADVAEIGIIADLSAKQVERLGAAIRKAAQDSGFGMGDTVRAMKVLIAAGQDADTASANLGVIGRVAKATRSNLDDVAQASFTLSDSLKVDPAGMEKALAALVVAGKNGRFEFREMAGELPALAAAMAALKMEGQEAVLTIGSALQIARKGAGSSSEAANNAANFLAKVLSPETLKKAQKEFGVDLYKVISGAQARGENPFEAAIAEIGRMTKGGDQKLLGELFQDMQVQGFLRPMLQNLIEYDRIKAEAAKAGSGVIDTDFLRATETARQALDEMGHASERLSTNIGKSLEPVTVMFSKTVGGVMDSIGAFVTESPRIAQAVAVIGGALLALKAGFLVAGFGALAFRGAMLGLGITTFAPMAKGAGMALRALLLLGRFMLLNPIGLALTAIGAAAVYVWQKWDAIRPRLAAVWGWMKQSGTDMANWFAALPDRMLTIGGQIIDGLIAGIRAKWEAGKAYVSSIPGQIADSFKSALGIRSPSRVFMGIGEDTMAGLGQGLGQSAPGIMRQMGGIARDLAMPIAASAALAGAPAAAAPASASGPVYNITVNATGSPQDIARAIRVELDRRDREAAAGRRSMLTDQAGF